MSMMGKINKFLGLNIRQNREGIFINQEKYMKNLLEKFGLTNSTKLRVPMATDIKLTPSLDKPSVDQTLDRSMIGPLLYLTISRPDIMFSVSNCVRYLSNTREPHFTAVKNIFRYLKGTILLGLWYPSKNGLFVQAYSDAELGGCNLDRKGTSGGCQLMDGKLDHVEDGNIEVHFMKTTHQLADIFTKPLDGKSFVRILEGLGMIDGDSVPCKKGD
ncbi:uncharacterized mitochondrial protein AtMg00810-like [Lactuca sativa]|uniref:uncharacterized mitochondrial protein AtMg00810-like n=1 Tax=Lactuca sativa TaxID=4236 RepID=UPI0022AF59DC|nr:uncharacterized mitochondrial protein AtMg00810-like [Lactuca sativa]